MEKFSQHSRSGRGRYASAVPKAAIVVMWILFVAWRPWTLGFVHDDWTLLTLNDPESGSLREGGYTRPLYLVFHRVMVAVLGDNAPAWHAVGAILVLGTAFFVYRFCRSAIQAFFNSEIAATQAAAAGACAWMLFPWGLGHQAWPVMFPGLLAVAAFCEFGTVLLSSDGLQSRIGRACIWYTVCNLIYEAFWLAFVPVVLLFAVSRGTDRVRSGVVAFAAIALVQGVFFVWNRLITHLGSGYGKYLSPDVLLHAVTSFLEIPSEFARALGISTGAIALILGMLLFCAVLIARRLHEWKAILALGSAVVIGVLASTALFAAAGYKITGQGVFSRTTIAINVWAALAVAAFSYLLLACRIRGVFVGGLAIVCAAALSTALIRETNRWAKAWELERAVLSAVPIRQLSKTTEEVMLLVDLPRTPGAIETFEAFWDITAALHISFPVLKRSLRATVMRNGEWLTTWDGMNLRQAWCRAPASTVWTLFAPKLLIWRYAVGEVSEARAPFAAGCIPNAPARQIPK